MALLVQSQPGSGSGSSLTVTLGSATSPGNCLIVCTETYSSLTAPGVTGVTLGGSAGNFASAVTKSVSSTNGVMGAIWADPGCAGGQTSVVISYSASAVLSFAWVMEWSGLATASVVDKTISGATTNGTSWSSGSSGTLTNSSELVVGMVASSSTSTTTLVVPGSPWTELAKQSGTSAGIGAVLGVGYQLVTSTSALTYNGTDSTGNQSACLASFFEASTVFTSSPKLNQAVMRSAVW